MSPFLVVMKAAEMAIAALQVGDALLTTGRTIYRKWRPAKPGKVGLSHRDVAHQQAQIRSATRGPSRK